MSSSAASSSSSSAPSARIRVGVAGCTGVVGQRFLSLLASHPWFELVCVTASDRSAGQRLIDTQWRLQSEFPVSLKELVVEATTADVYLAKKCRLVFSALDANVAGDIETQLATAGLAVFSNARNHRNDPLVPILIPHANATHLDAVHIQQHTLGYQKGGFIVTNANCSSTGLVVALRPLLDKFGLSQVFVTTLQAISGAGYPGVPSLDITDNVVPFISGEEEKMESEPLKILGQFEKDAFQKADFRVSATCNRVHVIDGHTECVSVKLKKEATLEQVLEALKQYRSEAQELKLPSAPEAPLFVHEANNRPQPRLDRDRENGYVVTVGRVRPCPLFDFKFTICSHNTVLGAAGGSILNAELAYAKGLLN